MKRVNGIRLAEYCFISARRPERVVVSAAALRSTRV